MNFNIESIKVEEVTEEQMEKEIMEIKKQKGVNYSVGQISNWVSKWNFKPRELAQLFVRIYCVNGRVVRKAGITRADFEVKVMDEEKAGYKYCVLVGPNGDGTFKERYEADMYEAIRLSDMDEEDQAACFKYSE